MVLYSEFTGRGNGSCSVQWKESFSATTLSFPVSETALSLSGKGMVVAEKRSTRSVLQVPFPHRLNILYFHPSVHNTVMMFYWRPISSNRSRNHHTRILVGNALVNLFSVAVRLAAGTAVQYADWLIVHASGSCRWS
jgi:hypothetical protein